MGRVLVVDGANVVGTRPDGWWKDRAGAASRLHGLLAVADTGHDEVVLVLEGQAKGGVPAGRDGHLVTVHAPRDGDASILARARLAVAEGHQVEVATADRLLARQVELAGSRVLSPRTLLELVGG